jgi:hypothetical protein
MWSNILLNFKINRVDVSGGSISKRHILQTVDFQLVMFLIGIFDKSKLMSKIVYNGLKDPILSSSIPLKYYKYFTDKLNDISNMKVKDIKNNLSIIENSSLYSEKELAKYNSVQTIAKSNLSLAIEMLIMDIKNGIKNELIDLQNTISNYYKELSLLSYHKSNIENIDSQSTKHMSNKEKKIFKKERAQIKSAGISRQLSELDSKISNLNNKKADIEEKLNKKESELSQFTKNSEEYTISDLIKLQQKYLNINNDNIPKLKKKLEI